MKSIIPLLAIVITIVFLLKIITINKSRKEIWPFYAKKILTQPEQVLYFRLIQSLPDYIIFAQVQLSQILGIKKGNKYQSWLNRINRMSVDFVVCNKDSSIVAVIELDDTTHLWESRKKVDAKKDKALKSANVRVIRWQAKDMPSFETIQSSFEKHKLQINR